MGLQGGLIKKEWFYGQLHFAMYLFIIYDTLIIFDVVIPNQILRFCIFASKRAIILTDTVATICLHEDVIK